MGYWAPKSTLPVVNKPNIRRVVEHLSQEGIEKIYVNSHLGRVLDAARDGDVPSAGSIERILEPCVTGTGTVVKKVVSEEGFKKGEPFLVVASDISHPTMCYEDFMRAFHDARRKDDKLVGAIAFLVRPYDELIERYPVAIISENNRLVKFRERPRYPDEAGKFFREMKAGIVREVARSVGFPCLPVNSSHYILVRELFDLVPEPRSGPSRKYDFGKWIFKHIPPERLFAYFIVESVRRDQPGVRKEWIDMATPGDFWLANWMFIQNVPQKVEGSRDLRRNLRVGENVEIHASSQVKDSVIGNNVVIGKGCRIEYSIIGHGSRIYNSHISKTIVLENAYLDSFSENKTPINISGSIIGGHQPILMMPDLSFGVTHRAVVPAEDGIVISPLGSMPEESQLAEDCFKRLR